MKTTDWTDVWYFCLCLFVMALLLTGCGHNIHVKGWGLASPCGAIGKGEFICIRSENGTRSETGK